MKRLNNNTITEGLEALGRKLPQDRKFEILILGGAAGVLSGELPGIHTTGDVDVVHFRAAVDRDVVLDAAAKVGLELALPLYWLNDDSGLFAWTLPNDWEKRRRKIREFGPLVVYTLSRLDLIAVKFLAHRAADLEHLRELHVTPAEAKFVSSFLDDKQSECPEYRDKIAMARSYLNNWFSS